ncbi:MAG: hypothetical protein ACREEM_34915, partial [Blastocatellia bacterium]
MSLSLFRKKMSSRLGVFVLTLSVFLGMCALSVLSWRANAGREVSGMAMASITVNDASGGKGGPGCKLRDALDAAMTDTPRGGCPAGSGDDTIVLPGGANILLTARDNADHGANGLPAITSSVTIIGNGATIQRQPGGEL